MANSNDGMSTAESLFSGPVEDGDDVHNHEEVQDNSSSDDSSDVQTKDLAATKPAGDTQQSAAAVGKPSGTPNVDEIALAVAKALQVHNSQNPNAVQPQPQQRQAPAQQQMSPEEIAKKLNKFSVTPDVYNAIFNSENPEDGIKALQSLVDGSARHAVTMAMHLVQDMQQQIHSRYQPYISMADQQREAALAENYYSQFPNHKGMDVLIQQAHKQMMAEKWDASGKNVKEIFAEVGNRVNTMLEAMQKATGQVPGQQNQQAAASQQGVNETEQQQRPKMPRLSHGGQGGAGNSPSNTPAKNTAERLFG